jgi:telomere length regulation protein
VLTCAVIALAQTILLLIGYLNRLDSKSIKELSQSSSYLQSVSNRLAASIPRARILGMIIGVAVSRLVDDPDKTMKFDIEEMDTEEVTELLGLVNVHDEIGDIQTLHQDARLSNSPQKSTTPTSRLNPVSSHRPKQPTSSTIPSIEEIESDSEDGDLIPYRKPDEDASDSEDDPTLINREKPTAPVYILDLIKNLQMSDKPDVVDLALKTAPSLIRRKANFGTELSENINTVASTLINLRDGMSKDEGYRLQMEGMIACLVALPASMGPWLASMYFEGDFSAAQRASLLTTIGLGTRELAGYQDDPKLTSVMSSFPSQRLPSRLESLYSPIDKVAKQIEYATLQPMALASADKFTGPDVLKVRTFSSRMEVEKKSAQKAKERHKRIPKDLHKLLAESFYLPLCCRMTLLLSAHTNFLNSTIFDPHIMKLFLQSLTILLTSLGPYAVQLSTVTRETLNLLVSLHNITKLSLDPVILPPLLQLLLTCLQVNIEAGTVAEERLVTDYGTMVAELVTWAGNISNVVSVPVGNSSDGMSWTILAAGCQVKWHEVGQKFQGRMIGLVGSDFNDF